MLRDDGEIGNVIISNNMYVAFIHIPMHVPFPTLISCPPDCMVGFIESRLLTAKKGPIFPEQLEI
jgi:hypothetical protein